ncbi:MAG: hypothetical protein IT361_11085 [Gemmatimonadaceae bacterium]|nr:hypothetical protein [Gemmatimonadaceae bacterium]
MPRDSAAQVASIASSAPILSGVAAWNVSTADTSRSGPNWLSIIVTSGAAQTMPAILDNSINPFPMPVSITTQWNLVSLVTLIDVVGYFAAPSSALVNGGAAIPSSRVEGRMVSGRVPTFTAFTQAPVFGSGSAGGTLHLVRQPVILGWNNRSQRTDQLDLRLNLAGAPALVPGTYTGTLTLRAVAY